MRICVYGAASPTIDEEYKTKVEELGRIMVERGHSLVFGGGGNGLMGAVARGVKAAGGDILGIIPKFFGDEAVEEICGFCNRLIEPDSMRERKMIMEYSADAFIVTPGGIGTFEEFFEILTLKQLCRHNKPIAVYNIKGYYDDIQNVMGNAIEKKFVKENCLDLYKVTDNLDELFEYLETPVTETRNVKELKDG